MTAQNQTVFPASGFGHQLKSDIKALTSCKGSISDAMMAISQIDNPDVKRLFKDLSKCLDQSIQLEYSADQKYKQND